MEQLHNLLVDIRWAVRELNQHLERIEPTPSSAGAATESSPPLHGPILPDAAEVESRDWQVWWWLKKMWERLAALEAGLQSPPCQHLHLPEMWVRCPDCRENVPTPAGPPNSGPPSPPSKPANPIAGPIP